MKILHINSYYSTRFFYKNLYDYQEKNGIELDVYVPVAINYRIPKKNLGNYTLVSKSYGKYDRAIFQIKHHKILKDVKKHYDFNSYELLHAHSLFSNGYIAYKLNQEYKTPYVVTVRNTDLNTFFKYMLHLRVMGIKILENAQKVIFLSTALRDELVDKYIPEGLKTSISEKSVIIPNGLDKYWLNNKAKNKKNIKDKEVNLLQVGIINKDKNALTTAKAAQILIEKGYKVKLNLVGNIENKKVLKKLTRKSYVNYLEPVPKEELIDIYRDNDIYIMPSLHETFGLVYAEAMSQGLPVLYSKGQGFDGQFPDGEVGYSVNKNNPTDISEKIIKIIENYEYFSVKTISNVDKFDWNKLNQEYLSLYNKLNKDL